VKETAVPVPVPSAFVAVTVNVYSVRGVVVRPMTVAGELTVVTGVTGAPPVTVTVYPVIGLPPLLAGAVHDTRTDPLTGGTVAAAETPVGAPGTVAVTVLLPGVGSAASE
jgi:hypothetical protein